ncbi:hypothetical protein QJS10_CPA01g00042 [Acorus calamus]|uniref:Uncharacterized protein n=1 Tax=Acorus calamus TaxID=4465 RepID=A0AAV9FMA4_ACOCL|nr:hypothetical protein QJS10_CPA01g00042 [Acorus calamus]
MDHERCEESRQTSLDFRCKKIIQSSGKLHGEPCSDAMSGIKDNKFKLDSPTPEKLDLPPRTHQMRKIIVTEISRDKHVPQVELPEKKFLYCHLAQIKYIFPDALKIEPVLVHNERSLCMKPDMKITLLLTVVADDRSNGSLSLAYCEAFHAKLLEFYNAHPESDGIPEAELPESFNSGNFMTQQEASALVSSMELSQPGPTNPEPSSIPKRALLSPDDGNLSFEIESCKAKKSLSFHDEDRSKVSVHVTEANREVDGCGHQKTEMKNFLVGEETKRYTYTHLQEKLSESLDAVPEEIYDEMVAKIALIYRQKRLRMASRKMKGFRKRV